MSWSTELWDQFDTVSNHTAKGIEFLDKLGHFIKDRCLIETDYASRLRKLAKNYDLNQKSKSNNRDDDKEFAYCRAFNQVLKEISDMAGQHEIIAENLSVQIVKEISTINRDLREERKRHLNEGVKYQNLLNSSLNQLDKSKKCYDKAFKESEKAHENYQKADKDLHLSRAELEKAKTIRLTKERACENSKTDYAKQLQVANLAQREHYTQFMPKVFQQLQELECRRIECTKTFLKLSAIIQKNVAPIIDKCLDGVIVIADSIDPLADAQLVVDRYKSGMQPPDDIPFEDLSTKVTNCETDSAQSKGSSLACTHSLKSDSLRHTFTARGLKKRTRLLGIFGANNNKDNYSELPPNQKRKKIQLKIDQLNSQIIQANGVKDGLIIMRQAYEENQAFGDPKTIESQLRENEATLERLNNDLAKHLVLLDEIEITKTSSPIANTYSTTSMTNSKITNTDSNDLSNNRSPSINNSNHRTSIGQGSELSRTNSDNSLRPGDLNNREATKSSATNRTSNSFNDSISDSISNNAISTAPDVVDGPNNDHDKENNNSHETSAVQDQSNSDNYEVPNDLPAQAYAKALYPFRGKF